MQQRPISVTIFGILNIGFALLGIASLLLSVFFTGASSMGGSVMKEMYNDPRYMEWTKISTPIAGIASIVLLAAGIGLLLLQNWGRIVSIIHAVFSILFSIAGCVVALMAHLTLILLIASVATFVFSLIYPILLIIFMTRPAVVSALKPPPVA